MTTSTTTEFPDDLKDAVNETHRLHERIKRIDQEIVALDEKVQQARDLIDTESHRLAELQAKAVVGGNKSPDGRTTESIRKKIADANASIEEAADLRDAFHNEREAVAALLVEHTDRLRVEFGQFAQAKFELLESAAMEVFEREVKPKLILAWAAKILAGTFSPFKTPQEALRFFPATLVLDDVAIVPPQDHAIMKLPDAKAVPEFWRIAGNTLASAQYMVKHL